MRREAHDAMLSSRYLFSLTIGLLSLLLGAFALYQAPNRRLHRFFALHSIIMGLWFIAVGPIVVFAPSHSVALFLYRTIQAAQPVHSFFLVCFIQVLTGVYDRPGARRIRHIFLGLIVLLLPTYPTELFIRDFTFDAAGSDADFQRIAGPLYPINMSIFIAVLIVIAATTYRSLRRSTGEKRNQLLFISLGNGMGLLAGAAVAVSAAGRDMPWLYFPLLLGMNICLAYAIFQYRLFEFGTWLRHFSIAAGVYLPLLSLPVFLYFPFRDRLRGMGESVWLFLFAVTVLYAIGFSFAPTLTAFIRHRADRWRWESLRRQLAFVQRASARLADENGLSLDEIARRAVNVLEEFYWRRVSNPIRFACTAVTDQQRNRASAIVPRHPVDEVVLGEFLEALANVPETMIPESFTALELEHRVQSAAPPVAKQTKVVTTYLKSNDIEICFPLIHDGRCCGAILLGAKERGLFWPEERATLAVMASHVATAVRKSELLAVNRELKSLDRLKTELISNITHEFKTPLNIVESAIDVLFSDVEEGRMDPKKTADYLTMIRNNTETLGTSIMDLLEIGRIESAKVRLDRRPADLVTIMENAAALVRPLAERKGLSLDVSNGPSIPVTVDVEKVSSVFCNLLSNAVKFTDSGGIRIAATATNGSVRAVISDSGRGIPPDSLPLVFEKFYQVPSTGVSGGTGLGLAIAKGWVEAHGGRIWAESEGAGRGAKFSLELPIEDDMSGDGTHA